MFKEDILCSTGGPCIMEIAKLFLSYGSRKIVLSSETLNRFHYDEKKVEIAEKIIDEVFLYLDKEDGAYKDYEKLRNLVKRQGSPWDKQRHSVENGGINRQKISDHFLLEEASQLDM